MFCLICAWINRYVNNGEAGNLRRYRAHYDVIVMLITAQNSPGAKVIFFMIRNILCVSTGICAFYRPLQKSFSLQISTERGMSFWRNIRHCLQQKLSSRQIPVQIMIEIPSKWHFCIKTSLYQKANRIFLNIVYPMLWGSLTQDDFPNCKRGPCHVSLSSVARIQI